MLDTRAATIIYQSQVYYSNLIDNLVENKKLGKALDSQWNKADLILSYLEAYNYKDRIEDITQTNYILNCLIALCKLYQFPSNAPLTFSDAPSILFGIQGEPGASITGPQGETGLATDFQISLITNPTIVDSFDITDATAARWDYTVVQSTGEQRSGSIIGTWSNDGADIEFSDTSTADIVGTTSPLEFDIQFSSGDIQLIAVPTSGQWTVVGSRYFIPNNGNGSGPISDVLPNGTVFIGNASNQAQSRTVSGVINITNTGVTSFTAGAIVNADVNNSAAIALTKLAALTANRLTGTDGSGFITALDTATYPSLTELSYVKGVTSALQTQLGLKLTDPTTTIGDIIIRNAGNIIARLGVGTNNQVLTVSGGVPSWQNAPGGISGLTTGFIPKAASATTINDSIISQSGSAITVAGTVQANSGIRTQTTGPYFEILEIDIGDWNMNQSAAGTGTTSVAHGITNWESIRVLDIQIRQDSPSSNIRPLSLISPALDGTMEGGLRFITSGVISLQAIAGGTFDSTTYNATGYNRGWILIMYQP